MICFVENKKCNIQKPEHQAVRLLAFKLDMSVTKILPPTCKCEKKTMCLFVT